MSLKGSVAGSPVGAARPTPATEPAELCASGAQRSRKTFRQVIASVSSKARYDYGCCLLAHCYQVLLRRCRAGCYGVRGNGNCCIWEGPPALECLRGLAAGPPMYSCCLERPALYSNAFIPPSRDKCFRILFSTVWWNGRARRAGASDK